MAREERRRRMPIRQILAAMVIVAVTVLLVQRYRSSNLEWYISSPIDSHGRRVHILVPVGWRPPPDGGIVRGGWTGDNNPDGARAMNLMAFDEPPRANILQIWLRKLRLVPVEESSGIVICLSIDHDVLRGWDELIERFSADGEVHFVSINQPYANINWALRAISIRGTNRQILIIFIVDKQGDERGEMANAICKSMYVE